MPKLDTYEEFWPYYLQEHSKPACRALHYVGTTLALTCIIQAGVSLDLWWLLIAPLVGYGFAWVAHFFIQGNKPATFGHPLWSLYSDFRMAILALTGRLGPELSRAGI